MDETRVREIVQEELARAQREIYEELARQLNQPLEEDDRAAEVRQRRERQAEAEKREIQERIRNLEDDLRRSGR